MRHLYRCPLRWADLDQLGHINNVTYVDYLQEARIDMLRVHAPDRRADELAEGVVVVRHEIEYRAPLTFRPDPVSIESWVTEIRAASFTIAYEIFDETPQGRVVYLRATTLLTPYVFATERPRRLTAEEKEGLSRFLEPAAERPAALGPVPHTDRGHYPVQVRFSDVDVYGHVNNVTYFEYFQEARIAYMTQLVGPGMGDVSIVVAHKSVEYKVPMLLRREPYDAWTTVSRVGNSSFDLTAEIRDGETLLARSHLVAVTFDPVTQRATTPPSGYRDLLLAELARAEDGH